MTLLLPDRIVLESLVRQGGKAETRISDANCPALVSHDLGRDRHQRSTFGLDHAARHFTAMQQH